MPYSVERDVTSYSCPPDLTIRDALQRFQALSPNAFQVVVDGDGRFQGTLTDGDVRRGILAGHDLSEPVATIMNRSAQTREDPNRIPEAMLQDYGFVPVVDSSGILTAVAIARPVTDRIRHCLVMAGGYGTRLAPFTAKTPKPLVQLGEQPILTHILAGLEHYGVRHAYLSVHYLADQFQTFVDDWSGSMDLELVHERDKLGTAGALGLLPQVPEAPILVVNGDVLTNTNYLALKDFHDQKDFDATIGVTMHDTEIPFGIVDQNADGSLKAIKEKPVLTHFVSAGIYYLSPGILQLVKKGETLDMPDLINQAADQGFRIGLFPIHEYWRDIGRPPDLKAASEDLDAPG